MVLTAVVSFLLALLLLFFFLLQLHSAVDPIYWMRRTCCT